MKRINIILQKLPLIDFLKSNTIQSRTDIGYKKIKENVKNIEKDLETIKKEWIKQPDIKLGEMLIKKGYVKDDPILSEVNEWKWMYINGHISDKEFKTYK